MLVNGWRERRGVGEEEESRAGEGRRRDKGEENRGWDRKSRGLEKKKEKERSQKKERSEGEERRYMDFRQL